MKVAHSITSLLLVSVALLGAHPTQAQIVGAVNDADTLINQSGNTFNITGGRQAGSNLFHSFQQFGLNQGQIANFLSTPSIQNILGRVIGGNASVIDGLIRVTGSNANLYLMNPAGIVFGSHASLNVPGSFTATTASGIGFGDNKWFSAFNANDYASLVGAPNSFALIQAGAIVNAGNLTVGQGQNVTLLGGTVISTGTIAASGGMVTITAIPEEKLVRITPEGSLLSIDLPLATQATLAPQSTIAPPSIPTLLTGGKLNNASNVTVNHDGTISLSGSDIKIPVEPGTAIVASQVDVAGAMGGTVHILGNKVGLVSANINASGTNGGGTVLVGGDYKGLGSVPNALQTFVSQDSSINASALQTGNGGRVVIWSDTLTRFYGTIHDLGGAQAGNGGLVEVSGKQELVFRGKVDASATGGLPGTLLLDPANIVIRNGTGDGDDAGSATTAFGNDGAGSNGQVQAGDAGPTIIYESELEGLSGLASISLEATNNITIEDLADNVLEVNGNIPSSITFKADSDNNGSGSFSMNLGDTLDVLRRRLVISGASVTAGDIDTGTSVPGATLEITSSGSIQVGDVETSDSAILTSTGGDIKVSTVQVTASSPSLKVRINISTPGLFQATGAVSFDSPFRLVDIDAAENADIKQFLISQGILSPDGTTINDNKNIIKDPSNQPKYTNNNGNPIGIVSVDSATGKRTVVENTDALVASILARDGDAGSEIIIRHSGKSITSINNNGFLTIETISGGNGNAQFVIGPQLQRVNQFEITEFQAVRYVPNTANGISYFGPAIRFQSYTPLAFGSDKFPTTVSGTAATIATDAFQNSNGARSISNLPFVPPTVIPDDGDGGNSNSGGSGSGGNSSTGNSSTGNNNSLSALRGRFQGEEGQITQRQFNNQEETAACDASSTIAAAPNTDAGADTRSPRATNTSTTTVTATNNTCSTTTQDDEQILKILGQ